MVAFARLKHVNVHVYEERLDTGGGHEGGNVGRIEGGGAGSPRYTRVTCFDIDGADDTVHVLYRGRCHYDALLLNEEGEEVEGGGEGGEGRE